MDGANGAPRSTFATGSPKAKGPDSYVKISTRISTPMLPRRWTPDKVWVRLMFILLVDYKANITTFVNDMRTIARTDQLGSRSKIPVWHLRTFNILAFSSTTFTGEVLAWWTMVAVSLLDNDLQLS